jgi:alpha-L-fucosidase
MNTKMFVMCVISLASAGARAPLLAADADATNYAIAPGKFQPTWESLKQYKCPEWFRDAKFGIWAHWGVQCVPEQGDWYAWHMYRPENGNNPIFMFQCETYGHPSKFGLKDLCNAWKAEKWDPEKLMQLYKKAGAQYFVAMGNHHDNFDNWDSKYQPWNAVNVGPKKDLISIWAKTARKAGLRFGVSIHSARAWDWLEAAHGSDAEGPLKGVPYDGALTKADGKGKWWDGLDPVDLYCPHGANRTQEAGRAYEFKFFQRVKDMLDKYHPDVLYFDDIDLPCGEAGMNIGAHFYNANLQWNKGRQEAILNTKRAPPGCRTAILLDIERGQRDTLDPQPWQTDTCIGDWHYKNNIGYREANTIVPMLVDIVSKNGNLLLNIPLKGDGMPDAKEVQILEQLSQWMAINSECIYGTRPWTTYGEGPALKLGAISKETRYFNGQTAADVRFTKKGDVLYTILLDWPGDGKSVVRSLAKTRGSERNKISSVTLLGCPDKLEWSQTDKGLVVTMPEKKPCEYAYTLRIKGVDLEAVPSKTDLSISAGADGRIVLAAENASLFGYSPAFRIRNEDRVISIGGWLDCDDYVTWDVNVGKPGSYTVEIEYGCPNQCAGSEYTIDVDGKALSYAVGPTGDWEKFKKEKVGALNLTKAGVYTLTIRPTKGKWHNAMNVRSVTLSAFPMAGERLSPQGGAPGAPSPARETRAIAGWTLHISRELLAQEPKATARALELLQKQLEEIVRVAPRQAVAELQRVPLYFSPEYPGVKPRAEYHPGAGWLRDNGRDPAMAKGVEFTNIRIFEREMNRMPNFALHELAHAYHDRVLPQGFGNLEIKAAYDRAKAGGKYDRVERWHGNGKPNTFERAYAMTDPQEFFAENTEAFFSRNDYFPFTRDELKKHDPETFALLEKLWAYRLEKDNVPK